MSDSAADEPEPAAEPHAEPDAAPIPADAAAHPLRTALLLLAAFGTGILVALQSRINGQLGAELGDGVLAALISFGSGFVILVVASIFWRPGRVGLGRVVTAVRTRSIPWWFVVGGAAGAFFVVTQSLVVGLVGVALFTVGIVAGQTVSSLLVDRRGMGSMLPKRVTAQRLVGAVLAVLAVLLAASSEVRPDIPLWVLIVPFAAGLAVGWQQAVNGQVKAVAGSAFTATFGNFAVGAALLLLAAVVHVALVGWPAHFPVTPWLYFGGAVGTIFIAGQAAIVRSTGVLLMGLAVLSGQLVTAVVFDVVAPVQSRPIGVATIVGAALTLVAVLVAALPRRARVR
jgi:transporter family-2 protein